VILRIESGGRTRAVDVARHGDRFLVSVDGRQHEVDVKEIDGILSLLIGPPEGGPYDGDARTRDVGAGFSRPFRSYEVSIAAAADGALAPSAVAGMMVHVDGVPVAVSITPARAAWAPSTTLGASGPGKGAATAAEGPQRLTSPMPGKIVKLLVKPGDKVDARQGLVVVEAMKMENELRARAAGTVTEVRVTEGSSVEAGAILVVLE
jgi:biotin carboxyl carrier protein